MRRDIFLSVQGSDESGGRSGFLYFKAYREADIK
jgi:hypothetical protein